MATITEGWALELCGDEIDLDDVRDSLKPPFDPWVEEYREDDGRQLLLLRSTTWVSAVTTGDMMAEGMRLIENINGAHLIVQPDARPIRPGIVLRFRSDGSREQVVLAGAMNITLQGIRARMRATTGGAIATPEASPVQAIVKKAGSDQTLADLLAFVTRADNWFDVFKAMELIERIAGGEAKVKALEPRWKAVRQTANRFRHAPSPNFPLPKTPADLTEARTVLLSAAAKVV